jgi:hypothetical protein
LAACGISLRTSWWESDRDRTCRGYDFDVRAWAAIGAACVALLASGCSSGQAQQNGQSTVNGHGNAKDADAAACQAFGRWDQVERSGKTPSANLSAQMLAGLEVAHDGTLEADDKSLQSALKSLNEQAWSKAIQAIGLRCYRLGLIDLNGNPT